MTPQRPHSAPINIKVAVSQYATVLVGLVGSVLGLTLVLGLGLGSDMMSMAAECQFTAALTRCN